MKKKTIQLEKKLFLGKTAIADLSTHQLEQLKGGARTGTGPFEPDTIQITKCVESTSPAPDRPCELFPCW
ncbi:class I lanthipeptide [Chitinophaga nivalis]|uniref:Class I lanthipeptide n=1 Tax=Chitinophaga nivalis TaxID=2991709 RepID=A0ABT3IK57_9BACT|nr:class I lanthipeptide [Chitinophaga nivalis]MCW3465958.1 class I lanthipeptide [Chitinophaga nivalis]MCW3484351.1 class I lanthipeptide [Chitinophaga nivalis]